MNKKDKTIFWIALGAIATLGLMIFAFFQWWGISPPSPFKEDSLPFDVQINPSFIYEKSCSQYSDWENFELILTPNKKTNLTFLELSESDVRMKKDISGEILNPYWDSSYNNKVFYFNEFSNPYLTKVKFRVYCSNSVFIGQERDLILTMTFRYTLDGEDKTEIISRKIDII